MNSIVKIEQIKNLMTPCCGIFEAEYAHKFALKSYDVKIKRKLLFALRAASIYGN